MKFSLWNPTQQYKFLSKPVDCLKTTVFLFSLSLSPFQFFHFFSYTDINKSFGLLKVENSCNKFLFCCFCCPDRFGNYESEVCRSSNSCFFFCRPQQHKDDESFFLSRYLVMSQSFRRSAFMTFHILSPQEVLDTFWKINHNSEYCLSETFKRNHHFVEWLISAKNQKLEI